MNRLLTLVAAACFTLAAHALPPTKPGAAGEFLFAEIEGKRGGPNGFALQHAARQAWPGQVDNAFRAEQARKAWTSFESIRFRGTSKGRKGVWQTVGPVSESDEGFLEPRNTSGRVTDLATGIACNEDQCRLYAATAGGGLWRTDRALHPDNPGWEHLGNGLSSNSIGAITVDVNDPSGETLYVGTGEANFNYSSAAGMGLFVTHDGGDSFSRVATMIEDADVSPDPVDFTATRGISQVAVKPGDPNTLYVATTTAMLGMTSVRGGQSTITGGPQAKVGLYKTTDAGANWQLLFEAPLNTASSAGTPEGIYEILSGVKDVQLDPQDPETVYISVADDGLYRSAPALDGDSDFHQVFKIVTNFDQRADSYAAFDLVEKDGLTRIYLYNGNGTWMMTQGLYRVDDSRVGHQSLYGDFGNTLAWSRTNSLSSPEGYVSYRMCNGQCVYDLVVASPPGQPDTVYIGGQLSSLMGDSTIRSIDGGETFTSMAVDLQEPTGSPHVDVRAIAFHPENPDITFVGSDGGVVRNTGTFGDGTHLCAELWNISPADPFWHPLCSQAYGSVSTEFVFMNRGLQTMQLYNISADPSRPLKRLMAGTQDNSTQWHDGTQSAKNWTKVFGVGDGTSANGFHPENPDILFASFQSSYFFTHFNGGVGGNETWLHTAGPIRFSGELQDPVGPSGRQFMTFDPSDADTQYTGFEHVWRTRNNGGDEATLGALGCRLNEGWAKPECGDWEALGEFLTRDGFGADRQGGVIVAAERSKADTGTLWSATSLGRVFVTRNVDAEAAAVTFDRLDNEDTPPRFISGIAVSDTDPNRAWVAYSGFNAVTPDTPGHVFQVDYDGEDAVFTSIDYNLGDMPITHLVRDDLTGDLYAATDFGVLVLPAGEQEWQQAGAGLPRVLTPHLEIHPDERLLFAATHGMGAWYINLGKQ